MDLLGFFESSLGNQRTFKENHQKEKQSVLLRNKRKTLVECQETLCEVWNVSKKTDFSYNSLKYHHKDSPNWKRAKEWGGGRSKKFSDLEEIQIKSEIFYAISKDPTLDRKELCEICRKEGYNGVNPMWITNNCFKKWNYSRKKCSNVHFMKYEQENVDYYCKFYPSVLNGDWSKYKYTDEMHVVDAKTFVSSGYSPKSQPCINIRYCHFEKPISITLLTSIADTHLPLIFNSRVESNSSKDYLDFIEDCCVMDYLISGDFLFADSAPGHASSFSRREMKYLENTYGFTQIDLPKYSPETNPCEKVFQFMKNYLRRKRKGNVLQYLIQAASLIDKRMMLNFYKNCINIKQN